MNAQTTTAMHKTKPYEWACEILKRKPKKEIKTGDLPKRYASLHKLEAIYEAINLQNKFVMDYANGNQEKWFPVFRHNGLKGIRAGWVFDVALYFCTFTFAAGGSRLVVSSDKEATELGKNKAILKLYKDIL